MATNYSKHLKKVCYKCKQEVPYFVSVNGGEKFKCPCCLGFVDILKCIVDESNNLTIEIDQNQLAPSNK